MELSTAIQQFLEYAEVAKNQSPRTLKAYRHYLTRFSHFAKKCSISDIDQNIVQSYRLHLNRISELSVKTQNYHLIALRAFLKYLAKNDILSLAAEKIELSKTPSRTVEFLTREEVERLMQSVDQTKKTGLRDRTILETLFSTGLRVSEIAALNRTSIDLERREFMVRGKGRKPRIVFLSSRAAKWLKQYLDSRDDHFDPLFLNHHGNKKWDILDGEKRRLTTVSIEAIVRKYAKEAGLIKRVTAHTLRHSFATELLSRGADIRSVQEMLGHASITTTQVYTHITNRKLKEVHEKFLA